MRGGVNNCLLSSRNQRDVTIDITKAFGILLMILGHWTAIWFTPRNLIYSFHMPLFFIFSGWFYKPKSIREIVISGNRHLLKPYLITAFLCVVLCLIAQDIELAKVKLIAIVTCSGGHFKGYWPPIGPIWFLMSLYWCKIFYAYLKRKVKRCFLWSFVISTASFAISKNFFFFPLGISVGLCGMVFYAMGDYWRNRMKTPLKKSVLLVGIVVWAYCVRFAHLEFIGYNCSLYPISMFAAFIGTYVTYLIASKTPRCFHPMLCWIGQNTLLILCYHTLSNLIILNLKHYLAIVNPAIAIALHNPTIVIATNFVLTMTLTVIHTIIRDKLAKHC